MKTTKLLVLLMWLVASLTFSASAQEEKVKTGKDKKTESKQTATNKTGRKYMVGAKGGCYYLTESGKKSYVDKKYCEGLTAPASESKTAATSTTTPDAKETVPPTDIEKTEAKPNEPATAAAAVETTKTKTTETAPTEAKKIEPTPAATEKKTDSTGRTYIRGSRGGCYYVNDSGKKVYVKDKSLCGN